MPHHDSPTIEAQIDARIHETLDFWIDQLGQICAQPSISAQGLGIADCAELTANLLREQGFEAEVLPSAGHPVVYGEGSGRRPRTLLFYNHYDVQPPEPLELWDSPPFTLTQRDGRLYARGVSDDKGHLISRLAAVAAVRDVLGELPCNIKFFVEGEEEIGSPSIEAFLREHRDRLAADACVWEFGSVDYDGRPFQTLGLRGMCYVELRVQTCELDAHSGMAGSIFPNAAWRLVWALNTIKGPDEQVRIPGFYDNVLPASPRDLEYVASQPDESELVKRSYGLAAFLKGMTGGLELRRAAVFDPTATINGLNSGYQGPGSKTVLPAQASAKVDFRLVPDQTPEEIFDKLRVHLDSQGFSDVELSYVGGLYPAKVDPDDPFVQLTIQAAADVYGKPPVVEPLVGGSGPMYPFVKELGLPIVSSGIGNPEGRVHAPNENVRIADFINGTRHTARILSRFAQMD